MVPMSGVLQGSRFVWSTKCRSLCKQKLAWQLHSPGEAEPGLGQEHREQNAMTGTMARFTLSSPQHYQLLLCTTQIAKTVFFPPQLSQRFAVKTPLLGCLPRTEAG